MPALEIKYYDPAAAGQWSVRRPQCPSSQRSSFSVLSIAAGCPESNIGPRVDLIVELLRSHTPTFVAINEVTRPLYTALRDHEEIRSQFGVTDFSPNMCTAVVGGHCRSVEHTCCFLVAFDAAVMFAEHNIKIDWSSESKNRPYAGLHLRQYMGVQFFIGCLHFDPANQVSARASAIGEALKKVDPADVALVFGNFFDSHSSSDALIQQLPKVIEKIDPVSSWSDTARLSGSCVRSHGLWMRTQEGIDVSILSVAYIPTDLLPYCSVAQLQVGSPSPSTGISIPQPRSAKVDPKSPKVPPTAALADPAVMSVDKQQSPAPVSAIGAGPQAPPPAPRRKWPLDARFVLRRDPSSDESEYIQRQFKSADEAVRALNSGAFVWNHDYVIVEGLLMACEGAKLTYGAFKKYVMDHIHQMRREQKARAASEPEPLQTPTTATHPAIGSLLVDAKAIPRPLPQRTKVWSERCATVIYQVTPLEMRFDISKHLGHSGSLTQAVNRLNRKGSQRDKDNDKPDPLATYAYDYALFMNLEKQGYWLLAATDVPCDIAQCRANAYALMINV